MRTFRLPFFILYFQLLNQLRLFILFFFLFSSPNLSVYWKSLSTFPHIFLPYFFSFLFHSWFLILECLKKIFPNVDNHNEDSLILKFNKNSIWRLAYLKNIEDFTIFLNTSQSQNHRMSVEFSWNFLYTMMDKQLGNCYDSWCQRSCNSIFTKRKKKYENFIENWSRKSKLL